jgi:hypothetical protein
MIPIRAKPIETNPVTKIRRMLDRARLTEAVLEDEALKYTDKNSVQLSF